MTKVINYYVSGNTAKGYHNLLDSNITGLRLYILKGGFSKIKSDIIKSISTIWIHNDFNVEQLQSAINNDNLEGVINRDLNIGVIDGSISHNLNTDIEEIDLDNILDIEKINLEEVSDLQYQIIDNYNKAFEHFNNGLSIHDEWEEIYISNMDRKRADTYTDEVIEMLIKDNIKDKEANVKHRFFGGATPNGPIDFIENLTSNISKRYFIKGRPGTGKSTLLKRLVNSASKNGLDVEVYHCGFDPNSLDMVILKELDLCIFDSTAPHEYYPSRDNDEVIDMYEEIITSGTDELYEDALNNIINRYSHEVSEGTNYLKIIKNLNDKLDSHYEKASKFTKIEELKSNLISKIL